MSDYKTTTVNESANQALSNVAKLSGKQKREVLSYLLLGLLTQEPDYVESVIARGRLVDIALEDGATLSYENNIILSKNSPYAAFFATPEKGS